MRGDAEFRRARARIVPLVRDWQTGRAERYQPGGLCYVLQIETEVMALREVAEPSLLVWAI